MKYKTSVKQKILLAFLLNSILLILSLGFLFGSKMSSELEISYNKNATDQLESILNNVITQHQSILFYKDRVLQNRKLEIKANVEIITSAVQACYDSYIKGEMSEAEAMLKAVNIVETARFNKMVGYFWINDNGRPFPKMIMHPTIPELDGTILDRPEFNCALGRDENLFKAFVDITESDNEGYVDYLWPKPTPEGLTEVQPKISYVKIFKPWKWIIGTGVYIDDIDREGEIRVEKVIKELNETMVKLKVGEHGYFFVFNSKSDMLVHPNLSGINIGNYTNPVTGVAITTELMDTFKSSKEYLTYFWDRPGDEGVYKFRKRAFVKYYKPLDWYIASSVYHDDYLSEVYKTISFILLVSIVAIIIVILSSLAVSVGLTKSLHKLMHFIDNRDAFGIPVNKIPPLNAKDFDSLRIVINKMIDSVINSKNLLEAHQEHLEDLVLQRTSELEDSIERLKAAQKQLIESEKIASLGGLVAGVAHEMNTPLGVGVTAASFLETKTIDFNKQYNNGFVTKRLFEDYINVCVDSSQIILKSLLKASDLVRSFKQVAVDTNIEDKRELNLSGYINEILKSMRTQLKSNDCNVIMEIDETVSINTYPTAISIIMINLINNSLVHGFKKSSGDKTITIRGNLNKGNLHIEFEDNGEGISFENINKIFDPFTTTNRSGGGKGLGLNIVYNLITQKLNGEVKVENRKIGGVLFLINLPVI